jgi:Ser/Thr protein kinase RdoA (MazF antagonist)
LEPEFRPAAAQGLIATDAIVLNDSNRLVLRLMPCDVVARVARVSHHTGSTELEMEVARRLAETQAPMAGLEPRVAQRTDVRDGFVVSMWKHYDTVEARELAAEDYARALQRLHAGLREIDVRAPHFMDRVRETQAFVSSRDVTPELSDTDRELLSNTLADLGNAIGARGPAEQLLHGEPHPWNILDTREGLLFMDFENAARGPVEYDLAWVPADVSAQYSARYPDADQQLIELCRGIVLAIIAAHRWRRDDQHPSGPQRAAWVSAVRQGPPWPALDSV